MAYCQDVFLPAMAKHFAHLVRYQPGAVDKEVLLINFVKRPLVLIAQDEMTSHAHDTVSKSWFLGDEHALRKKGVGRGLHQSDVV